MLPFVYSLAMFLLPGLQLRKIDPDQEARERKQRASDENQSGGGGPVDVQRLMMEAMDKRMKAIAGSSSDEDDDDEDGDWGSSDSDS